MDIRNKASRIRLFSFNTPQMRAFHMSWFAFHVCFFGWFGIAPLMAVVRDDLGLTKTQIGGFRDSSSAKVGAVVRCEDGSSRSRPGTHTLRARRRLGMPTIEIIKPRTSGACFAPIRSCRDARPSVRAGSRARGRCWRWIRGWFGSVLIIY